MELLTKAAGAAIICAAVCLLLRKNNPDLALLLSLAACAVIMLAALSMAGGLTSLAENVKRSAGVSPMYIEPVLKCTGISIAVKLTGDICRDASQSGLASAVELAGTVCAFSAALPLINALITTVCELV